MTNTNLLSVRVARDLFRSLNPLRLSGVPMPVRWVAVANLLALAVLGLLIVSDFRGTAKQVLAGGPSYFPAVIIVTLVAAGIAMTALGVAASRVSSWHRAALSIGVVAAALLALTRLLPEVPGRGAWVAAGLFSVAVGLFEMRRWESRRLPVQILALFIPYLITVIGVVLRGSMDPVFIDMARAMTPLAAVAAGVLVIASVAEALQSRHPGVSHWMDRPLPHRLVVGALLLKFVVIAAFYVGAGGDFLGGEKLWNPRTGAPLSWLHALLVATAIYAIVVASEHRPLADSGREPATAAILVSSSIGSIAALMIPGAGHWVVDHQTTLQLVAIVALAIAASVEMQRRRRLTAGTALLLLAGLWLTPALAGILADEVGADVPTFWATPIQVDVALTGLVTIAMFTTGRWRISTRVQLRMLLLPALLIYSGVLLPDSWDIVMGRALLILAVVWLLAARAPRVAADPRQQTRVLCTLLGAQLATLVVYYLALGDTEFERRYMSTSALYGWLWFAVPLSGILTARMSAHATHTPSGGATDPKVSSESAGRDGGGTDTGLKGATLEPPQ